MAIVWSWFLWHVFSKVFFGLWQCMYCLWCKSLCSIISTYWGLMCWLWIKVIYLEGGIISLSKSVKNTVNHFHMMFLCSVLGTVLVASQTISLEHRKSAGESHVFATFGQGIWVSEKSTENWMEIQSVWTHTWATGHHTLETCMWSIYWPPQPLEARSRVVSPGGGLGSLPKQGLPPETAWC